MVIFRVVLHASTINQEGAHRDGAQQKVGYCAEIVR